jgi:photosystem II stability/assembly factor-like uncharacterized protein
MIDLKALRNSLRSLVWAAVAGFITTPLAAIPWYPLGPYGGDARAIAADPQNSQHLFLGTVAGWLYESNDGGGTWKRVSRVAKRDDLVLDHILLDPLNAKHLIVGGWVIDRPDGGLYESHDGGLTWYNQAEMRGQSVRALAGAPSDPKMMVAGTLKGVYRTMDAGAHWQLISPEGSTEIHEVESVAIDPVDPNIIYAGTWHLPWKTTDGGKTWSNIKQGIIDDSDVFSIIIDPNAPQTVYASACSGIYKSVDAGGKFVKVQGIPSTARRTRKLAQDPLHPEVVFAGTTQGLFRTQSSGKDWSRLTGDNVIINDVFIDPKNSSRVLLATDRAGVLASDDGGVTFQPSNTGFSARQVTSFAADPQHTGKIYVGVVNDKAAGGVFMSTDGGVRWQQQSMALMGRDVFSLVSTDDGTLLAGTSHGIFRLDDGMWSDSGLLAGQAVSAEVAPPPPVPPTTPKPAPVRAKGKPSASHRSGAAKNKGASKVIAKAKTPLPPPPPPALKHVDATVYTLAATGDAVYAGTSQGLMKGTADGHLWTAVDTPLPEPRLVAAEKSIVMEAGFRELALSTDAGNSWKPVSLPEDLTQIASIAVDDAGNLWIGGREGLFYSPDKGATWKTLRNLFVRQVTGLYFDRGEHRVLVTATNNTVIFAAHVPDFKVSYWDSGWNLRFVRPVGDHLVGATFYDGMVVQPQMVASPMRDAQ